MRILDDDTTKTLKNVTIYLNFTEAQQMLGYLEQLVADPQLHHEHLNDEDYHREITIAVYTPETLEQFDQRSKEIILADDEK